MAGEPGRVYTLRENALNFGSGGKSDVLINMLSQANPMLEDCVWMQGNLETGHRFKITDGLPEVQYRSINEGIIATRGTQKDIVETCSLLESVSEIDKELIDIAEDKGIARLTESAAHIESLGNTFAKEMWYGSRVVDHRSIVGLAQSYANLNGPAKRQIIDAGGTATNNASIWLIVWGQRGLHGIYPKNTRSGIEHISSDVIDIIDPENNGTYQGYRDRFKWRVGLCLKDYRQVGRIANIDMNDVWSYGTANDTSPNLVQLLLRLTHRINRLGNWNAQDNTVFSGKPVIYMNRSLKEAYEVQLMDKQNLALTIDAATGAITTSFKGIPIKVDDSLLETEERVV